MHYIRVGLIYKPHGLFARNIKRCATFFDRCGSEIDVAPSQAYFLCKRRGVGPLCHPMPYWICVDTFIPCPGVVNKDRADTVGVHSSQVIISVAKTICIPPKHNGAISISIKGHDIKTPTACFIGSQYMDTYDKLYKIKANIAIREVQQFSSPSFTWVVCSQSTFKMTNHCNKSRSGVHCWRS